jgi:hypothetical protein
MTEEIFDFLHAIYLSSNRREPYWVAAREQTRVSDWLREKLELWRHRFPDFEDTRKNVVFGSSNYIYLLFQQGYFSRMQTPVDRSLALDDWKAFGKVVQDSVTRLSQSLPSHYELLTRIRDNAASRPIALTGEVG